MFNLHAKFSSEEAVRYGAECSRLGRLSRNRKIVAKPQARTKKQAPAGGWLAQLFGAPRRPPRLAHR